MRIVALLVGVLVGSIALLRTAQPLLASDSSTVNFGASQNITSNSICKKVTNNSPTGKSIYVPTQSAAEWASFYTNPPAGVTVGLCGSTCNTFTKENVSQPWKLPASYCDGINEYWWYGDTTRVKGGTQVSNGNFSACRNYCQSQGASCCQFIAASGNDWNPNCIAFVKSYSMSYTNGYFDMEYGSTAALCRQ